MGSRDYFEAVAPSKWWEAKAQQMFMTATVDKVEVICSLLPLKDEMAGPNLLKARPDLDTLFELRCRDQDLSEEQRTDPSNPTVDSKANQLWRVLRIPPGCGEAPWNWNWQLPLDGIPSEIAAEFHVTVCQAIFRIPLSDFVDCALGYNTKAKSLDKLFVAVCNVRQSLRTEFERRPGTMDTYIKVEKVLKQQHHPLAHWIVASSLQLSEIAPYDTLASNLEPIRKIFATRDFDLVLTRLAALDRRFAHGSRMYNWQKWSADLDFWQSINVALWSGKMTTPFVPLHLSSDDRDERLRFLDGFETGAEEKVRSGWSKVVFSMKRLMGRNSQYGVKKGLLMSIGLLNDSPKRS